MIEIYVRDLQRPMFLSNLIDSGSQAASHPEDNEKLMSCVVCKLKIPLALECI